MSVDRCDKASRDARDRFYDRALGRRRLFAVYDKMVRRATVNGHASRGSDRATAVCRARLVRAASRGHAFVPTIKPLQPTQHNSINRTRTPINATRGRTARRASSCLCVGFTDQHWNHRGRRRHRRRTPNVKSLRAGDRSGRVFGVHSLA